MMICIAIFDQNIILCSKDFQNRKGLSTFKVIMRPDQ